MNICKENQHFFIPPPQIFSVGGLKTFLNPPKIVSVCGGGLKTETGKLHEILTSVCGGSKIFFYTPPKFLVCVGGV